MKKVICICVVVHSLGLWSQETNLKKNELRLNPLYLFSGESLFPELSYERAMGSRAAMGLSLGVRLGADDAYSYVDDFINQKFSLVPYYRHYFGRRAHTGFFLEGNSIVLNRDSYVEDATEWKLGLGIGIGYKFELQNAWNIDFVVGGGGLLGNKNDSDSTEGGTPPAFDLGFPDMYPRLGITLGKRF